MRRDIAEIKREYAQKTKKQAARHYINNALNNMSDKDRDLMKVLANFDDATGGRLDEFYHLLTAIKNQPDAQ